MANSGQCNKCGENNPYTAVICSACRSRLPWAQSAKLSSSIGTQAPRPRTPTSIQPAPPPSYPQQPPQQQPQYFEPQPRPYHQPQQVQHSVGSPIGCLGAGLLGGCGAAVGWGCIGPIVCGFLFLIFISALFSGC